MLQSSSCGTVFFLLSDGSATEIGTTKKASKPKKKHSYKTIEQNIDNLNISEADRKCEVDPMFQKTAASFDECSTAGVFLSSLHCCDYRSELLFPSDIQSLSTAEPLELPDLGWVEMTDLKGKSELCFSPGPSAFSGASPQRC